MMGCLHLVKVVSGLLTCNDLPQGLVKNIAQLFISTFALWDVASQTCFVTAMFCKWDTVAATFWSFYWCHYLALALRWWRLSWTYCLFSLCSLNFRSSPQLLCAASANAMVTWRMSVLKTLRRSSWSLFLLWTTASGISLMGSAGCATVSSLSLYIILLLYIILEENCEKLCLQWHKAMSLNVSFCLTYIQKLQRFHSRWQKPRNSKWQIPKFLIPDD